MTPSQLRHWSFQNSQPDQWWISLDAVTEEIPVTVAEIEERMKSGDYSAVQALHVSQAGMENAPWVEVAMPPPMKAPPMMQPPIAVGASISVTPSTSTPSPVSAQTAVDEKVSVRSGASRVGAGIGFVISIGLGYFAYLFFELPEIALISYIFTGTVFFLLKNFGK